MDEDEDLGPTLAEFAGIELVPEPPFDPYRVTPGSLDRRILNQAQVWVDRTGAPRQLASMSDGYRANVVAHLHTHAFWMWSDAAFEELLATPLVILAVQDEAGVPLTGDLDPHHWLESTPLVRELRRLSPTIASPVVLTARAAHLRALSAGVETPMPQDPTRSWTRDMQGAPPCDDHEHPPG
jgi:hypothetical protein